jgi:putative two-component system response regulator
MNDQDETADSSADTSQYTVIMVDDEQNILQSLQRIFRREQYRFLCAGSGTEGLKLLTETPQVAVIVSDQRMPEMNGGEFLTRSREIAPDAVRMLLSGYSEMEATIDAINKGGATHYISKPWEDTALLQTVRDGVNQYHLMMENRRQQKIINQQNEELKEASKQVIRRLGKAAEYRDNETGKHVIRVAHYSRILAEGLGLDSDLVELIYLTAPMHDIGKIGIPDEILKKKDKLKPIEYEIIKKHSLLGGNVLQPLNAEELGYYNQHMLIGRDILEEHDTPLLHMAASIAYTHHEKWDGTGYPAGLTGKNIPLEGRIVAIADVFDALTSKRYYKPAFALTESIAIINEMKGIHFDPAIVDCFNARIETIIEVVHHFSDDI